MFNEITPERDPEGVRKAAGGQHQPGGGAAGAPRARPAGGLQDLAAAVGQGAPRTFGRRVQTVALRLIVEREREIRAFQKREYWTIDVQLDAKKPPVSTRGWSSATTRTSRSPNEAAADAIVAQLDGADYIVAVGRHAREEAQSGRAVHHVHAAAGSRAQAALQREAHHDARAAAV